MADDPYDTIIYTTTNEPRWPWEGVTGGASGSVGGRSLTINGRAIPLPDNWYLLSPEAVYAHVGQYGVSREEYDAFASGYSYPADSYSTSEGDGSIFPNGFFNTLFDMSPIGSAAAAAGAAGRESLQALAGSGDFVAKIALAFGIGYAAATALLLGGGALFLLMYLKK